MAMVDQILVRMKTLSVQSGSGQLSAVERGLLDTEYQALLSEVDRIAADTEFNGVSMVNGSNSTTTSVNSQSASNNLVEAADGFQSIAFSDSVGNASFTIAFNATTNVLTLTNLTSGASQGIGIGSTAIAGGSTQTVDFTTLSVVVTLNTAFDKTSDIAPTGTFTLGGAGTGAVDNTTVTVTAADATSAVISLDSQAIVMDHTAASATTFTVGNFTGSVDMSSTGNKTVLLDNGSSADFTISFTVTTAFANSGTTSSLTVGDLGTLVFGQTATSSATTFSFKLGTGTTANVDDVTFSVSSITASALSLNGGDITTIATSDTASVNITAALDTLNTARAGIGANQNRLQFASDNLAITIENSEAARSNLMDLDVAAEMTMFTGKLVLVQAGVAMLAQANQLPQNLLRLFQF
jgi:flagellin